MLAVCWRGDDSDAGDGYVAVNHAARVCVSTLIASLWMMPTHTSMIAMAVLLRADAAGCLRPVENCLRSVTHCSRQSAACLDIPGRQRFLLSEATG